MLPHRRPPVGCTTLHPQEYPGRKTAYLSSAGCPAGNGRSETNRPRCSLGYRPLRPASAFAHIKTVVDETPVHEPVRTGDLMRAYATHYDRDGWVLRLLWCEECGESAIEAETDGADEVIVEAVFWEYRLVSVEVRATSTW